MIQEREQSKVRRLDLFKVAVMALFFIAAPTAGDIGSCGQAVVALDAAKFFTEKQRIDCGKCLDCGLDTQTCVRACFEPLEETSFHEDCFPLVHDGEVCLHALSAASCEESTAYLSDIAPTVPTECNFCPPDQYPEGGQ